MGSTGLTSLTRERERLFSDPAPRYQYNRALIALVNVHSMFRRQARSPVFVCSALTLASASVFGRLPKAESQSHAAAHLITEDEVKQVLTESHGETKQTYNDFSELPSLAEDGHCQGTVGNYLCWGIFDGHGGWSASNYVSQNVLKYLNESYNKRKAAPWWKLGFQLPVDDEKMHSEFDNVICDAFANLDKDIVQAPLKALNSGNTKLAAESLPIALSGSCAMMAFYHPLSHILKVALVGDSRTVMGVQDKKGMWHATSLTEDQTGGNPTEISRIRSEHPNDPPGIVKNGRVLGYEPSRSFGDASIKYTKSQLMSLRDAFWTRTPNPLASSPPYLTAQPVISTVTVEPSRPTFIVMGCDGLYEWLSNDQIVSLVGRWLEKNPVIHSQPYNGVVDHSSGFDSATFKRPQALNWPPLEPIVKDGNVATHLIRNALGGADFKKVSLLMSIPSPMSRRHRDDITCNVVFFIHQSNSKL